MKINNLVESGIPYKSLQSDSTRLASKWEKTGLLKGLDGENDVNNMSMMLENQVPFECISAILFGCLW